MVARSEDPTLTVTNDRESRAGMTAVATMMLASYPGSTIAVRQETLTSCITACLECPLACTACSDACMAESDVAALVKCSASQTGGAVLCDCDALYPAWRRRRAFLAVADWLDAYAEHWDAAASFGITLRADHPALAVARAYLGEVS